MADTKPKLSPVPTDADPQPTPAMRVEACGAEIRAVLEKHRCELRAFLTQPEPVGTNGDRAMISASYALFPRS